MQRIRAGRLWPLFLCLALAACSGASSTRTETADSRPVIQEQSTSLRAPDSPYRTVVPGDTLYSIAWESGRDYQELARWNGITAPYTIKPGQRLRVVPPTAAEKPVAAAGRDRSKPDAAKRESKPPAAKPAGKPPASPAHAVSKPKSDTGAARVNVTPSGAKSSSRRKPPAVASGRKAAPAGRSGGVSGGWVWPSDGKVLSRYSESESKGLDFSGARGDPVRAAASGRVVYQGSGLRGYGQLIIIKHSDEFLSAYAHNDRIHVKEGEAVKRGQKIADMGNTGTDRIKLHFEIRRHGAPVDPVKYLPRR